MRTFRQKLQKVQRQRINKLQHFENQISPLLFHSVKGTALSLHFRETDCGKVLAAD